MSDLLIKGARENNLKSIDISIPDNSITTIVGPSGSGKSSLAFNTIYLEGQRRYIESLSSYVRQFLEKIERPDFDEIINISPTVGIEQKNKIKNSRSTVSSITEIYDYLTILYAKVGKLYCDTCNILVEKYNSDNIFEFLIKNLENEKIYLMFKSEKLDGYSKVLRNNEILNIEANSSFKIKEDDFIIFDRLVVNSENEGRIREDIEKIKKNNNINYIHRLSTRENLTFPFTLTCKKCGKNFLELEPRLFSFDSIGACPNCNGYGNILEIDEKKIVPDENKSLLLGAIDVFNKPSFKKRFYEMINFLRANKVDVNKPYKKLTKAEKDLIYKGGKIKDKSFIGIDKFFKLLDKKKYKVHVRVLLSRYKTANICKACSGSRLIKEALNVKIKDKNIYELQNLSFSSFYSFLANLNLNSSEEKLSFEIIKQLLIKTKFINEVGLGYISLDRAARTLSNGEAQRVNIANQLSYSLVDTIYVLDEPSIGLHPKDIDRLIGVIFKIRDNGNKVIVVEHDSKIIKSSDKIIEFGPSGGINGGNLMFEGSLDLFLKSNTLTSKYLNNKNNELEYKRRNVGPATKFLKIDGINENNLKNVSLTIPLERFISVTGVSGSGKSSLITSSLYGILNNYFEKKEKLNYTNISGLEYIKGVMLIDQDLISKSNRSIPLTYLSLFDDVREFFASTELAKIRGYKSSHFSFNTSLGKCKDCGGDGFIEVDMQFMPSIEIKCETCGGSRYKKEILDIKYKDKNIEEVLKMTFREAYDFFINNSRLRNVFKFIIDIGLDYLVIGQSLSSLSGGETQRLKIVKEIMGSSKKNIYIMDEPTTGLHPSEVERLIEIIQKIINSGSTIVAIEHNMDFVKHSDYIIDLGPGGGIHGGNIVAEGIFDNFIKNENSVTANYLRGLK